MFTIKKNIAKSKNYSFNLNDVLYAYEGLGTNTTVVVFKKSRDNTIVTPDMVIDCSLSDFTDELNKYLKEKR